MKGHKIKTNLLDIRQAAEAVASATRERPVDIAQKISEAGQFHGLRFYGVHGQPVSWMPSMFTLDRSSDGQIHIKPSAYTVGGDLKAIQSLSELPHISEPDDGVVIPYFRVDIVELLASSRFDYHKEIQTKILAGLEAQVAVPPEVSDVKMLKMRQQEIRIIEWLKANGHDPKNMPTIINGDRTAKADARHALDGKDLFTGKTTFNKAWDRLRTFEEIKEAS